MGPVGVDAGARIGDVAVVAGAVGRPVVDTAAEVVVETGPAPVDTAVVVVGAGAGLRPKWTKRDLGFFVADDDDEGFDGDLMGDAAEFVPFG